MSTPSTTASTNTTTETPDPKEIVRTGYNGLSYFYRSDTANLPHYTEWMNRVLSLLSLGNKGKNQSDNVEQSTPSNPSSTRIQVLDVGCGCGIPIARDLTEAGASVVGVDISDVQIQRAKQLVPRATFIHGDVMDDSTVGAQITLANPEGEFDAVFALYVVIHIPIAEQREFVRRLARWTRVGGYILFITGISAWQAEIDGWLGSGRDVKMWWQQTNLEEYRSWIVGEGLTVIREEHVLEDGNEGHWLFLLQKLL